MVRYVEICGRPEHAAAFAVAAERWLQAEPLAMRMGVSLGKLAVRVQLHPLEIGDGPNIGMTADDRPRAAALLRAMMPAEFVASATVDGRDWRE